LAELFGVSTFQQSEWIDSWELFGAPQYLKLGLNIQ
jgi:hypothetical protein